MLERAGFETVTTMVNFEVETYKSYMFVVGYECLRTKQKRLVKFFTEKSNQQGGPSFRPFYRSQEETLQNKTVLGDELCSLIVSDTF